MLKKMALFLCAVALMAAFGADDDLEVLWEEPYDFEWMTGGFWSYGPYYTQDDFILENEPLIEVIEFWAFYYPFDDDEHPQRFTFTIRYDHYGMPGGVHKAFRPSLSNIEETDTGDVHGGFHTVWHYRVDLGSGFRLEGGTPWWLEIYSDAENFSWACRNFGNVHYQWNQHDYSAFFRLLGTPEETQVQPASWGEIKAGFSE